VKITPAILQHEFIGLNAKVVKSSNPNYVGIKGNVVNETHNTRPEDRIKKRLRRRW